MLSVYKSFHQTAKYGRQRNLLLQDLTGLEISMKASRTEHRFETRFQQPKTGLTKRLVLTSLTVALPNKH